MDIEIFEQAEPIVEEIRKNEQEHIQYQDVITGISDGLEVSTSRGRVNISDPIMANEIKAFIDGKYFEKGEELKKDLERL